MRKPLVSIMIPNFNHSRYLDECIQSALNQTYENIEIIILDNASTDHSVEVARAYQTDERVRVCRNQFNILNKNYRILAERLAQGKYLLLLCADDYIYPTFIEKAVRILEEYPDVGYVHGEKDFITENGEKREYDSFYKCSFVAPGRNTMPIYMVTTVAHPTQGVIRKSAFVDIGGYDKEIDHMNADKTLWFYLSYEYDAAYIQEKMCAIRIGSQTETFITQRNFQHPILCHLTIKDFVKYAKEKELPQVYKREQEAMERLAGEFLTYAAGMLSVEDYEVAQSYLLFAKVVSRKICKDKKYEVLLQMVQDKTVNMEQLKAYVVADTNKKRGYEPPEGYIELQI